MDTFETPNKILPMLTIINSLQCSFQIAKKRLLFFTIDILDNVG